ncbi:MAG: hypothetical protein ACYDAO_09315 [Thermoplasmataceae archaeon]
MKTPNQIARTVHMLRATEIIIGDDTKVLRTQRFGYRKNTTGEYVPKKYLSNFGWKNTYYQPAECVVMLNIENFY